MLTCSANLPTANEPIGANALTVSQAGDANYTGSTGSGSVNMGKAAVTRTDTATGTGDLWSGDLSGDGDDSLCRNGGADGCDHGCGYV